MATSNDDRISSSKLATFATKLWTKLKATFYIKPGTGIPKTDLESTVQTSLGKADTALQSHQDISGKVDNTETGFKNLRSNVETRLSSGEIADDDRLYPLDKSADTPKWLSFANLWTWIEDNISSALGLTSSQYNGNSATATKATQDASGNVITTTYVKHDDYATTLSGGTIVSGENDGEIGVDSSTGIGSVNGFDDKVDNTETGFKNLRGTVQTELASSDIANDDRLYPLDRSANTPKWLSFYNLWTWIAGKISSVLGLTVSQYGGNAATATLADSATQATSATTSTTSNQLGGYHVYSASATYYATLFTFDSTTATSGSFIITLAQRYPRRWCTYLLTVYSRLTVPMFKLQKMGEAHGDGSEDVEMVPTFGYVMYETNKFAIYATWENLSRNTYMNLFVAPVTLDNGFTIGDDLPAMLSSTPPSITQIVDTPFAVGSSSTVGSTSRGVYLDNGVIKQNTLGFTYSGSVSLHNNMVYFV